MTDNEITKALECCARSVTLSACEGCPLKSTDNIQNITCANLENFALDLINRQKAEIEELNECYTNLSNANVQHCLDYEKDRQLLGEYQNIFLDLGFAMEISDPELKEIKAWKDRMLWHYRECTRLFNENKQLELRIKNANEHEIILTNTLKNAKAEAVKEFDELLKEDCLAYPLEKDDLTMLVDVKSYNNLVKEMAGEEK